MGDFVVCSQCLAAQAIDMADQPFPFAHLLRCVAIRYGLYPWHELKTLLEKIPLPPMIMRIKAENRSGRNRRDLGLSDPMGRYSTVRGEAN